MHLHNLRAGFFLRQREPCADLKDLWIGRGLRLCGRHQRLDVAFADRLEIAFTQFFLIDQRVAIKHHRRLCACHALHVTNRCRVGHRHNVEILVGVIGLLDRLRVLDVVQLEIFLLVEVVAVQPAQDTQLLPKRAVDALEDRGHDLLALLDKRQRGRCGLVGRALARQDVLDACDVPCRLDQHAKHRIQHRRRPRQRQRHDVVAQRPAGRVNALPFAQHELEVSAFDVDARPDKAALGVL